MTERVGKLNKKKAAKDSDMPKLLLLLLLLRELHRCCGRCPPCVCPSVRLSVVEEFCRRFVLCGGTKGHNVESGRSVVRSV
jgi:hypothetical protein